MPIMNSEFRRNATTVCFGIFFDRSRGICPEKSPLRVVAGQRDARQNGMRTGASRRPNGYPALFNPSSGDRDRRQARGTLGMHRQHRAGSVVSGPRGKYRAVARLGA
jgi:hypothetical protein